jgi:hypothetical protein
MVMKLKIEMGLKLDSRLASTLTLKVNRLMSDQNMDIKYLIQCHAMVSDVHSEWILATNK